MASLTREVTLITGARRGQGAVEAQLFAKAGAAVAICDVLRVEAQALATSIRKQARFIPLNVSLPGEWADAIGAVQGCRGRLEFLVNNAGIINRPGIVETSLDAWNAMLSVNLTGVFLDIQATAPAMQASGGGSIINIASVAEFIGYIDAAYTVSRSTLHRMTYTAVMKFVGSDIRVNSACSSLI